MTIINVTNLPDTSRRLHSALPLCKATCKRQWLLPVLVLIITLAGCGKEQTLTALPADATILAFGDSLTFGKGVSKSDAYPAVLQKLTSLSVINAGISGETTSEGLLRLPELLTSEAPDLLILFEGGNDILRKQDLTITKSNLDKMIQLAKKMDVPVVLVGVPTKSLLVKTAGFYAELAEQHEIPLEGSIVSKLIKKPSMKSDSVHFNVAGYRALAEAIFELLKDNGAV